MRPGHPNPGTLPSCLYLGATCGICVWPRSPGAGEGEPIEKVGMGTVEPQRRWHLFVPPGGPLCFAFLSSLFTRTELGQQVTAVTQLWQPVLIKSCQPGESCQAAGDQRRVWPVGKVEGMRICLWLRRLFSRSWLWRQAGQGHGRELSSGLGRSLPAGLFPTFCARAGGR